LSPLDGDRPRDPRQHEFGAADRTNPGSRFAEDLLPSRSYPSSLFWRLTSALDPEREPGRILDLGPTNNANILFWAERGFDVTCCDLFAREARRIGERDVNPLTLSSDSIRDRRLPYDSESFTAVCAWNVLSRLPFVLAQQYARECHRLLVPSGLLHGIFLDADGRLDTRRIYQVEDRQQLRVTSVAVPRKLPSNWVDAEIRLMLARFAACEIQAAPSHTREVLAQRSPVQPLR
jgi:SAM-dependent methyltransferase